MKVLNFHKTLRFCMNTVALTGDAVGEGGGSASDYASLYARKTLSKKL